MDEIEIVAGIALPDGRTTRSPLIKAVSTMTVGDSFFLDGARSADDGRVNRVRNWGRKQTPQWRFTARQFDAGVRVWRIA